MPFRHLALALVVVVVWGTNFVVIKAALAHFSPLWLAAMRFTLAALPFAFFAWPKAPWRSVAAYGLLLGVGQFALLFIALRSSISPGLASLIVQSQVFFTLGLAWLLRGQALKRLQILALSIAVAGVLYIAIQLNAAATPLGMGLSLAAGFFWGCANIVNQRVGKVDMLSFVVWSSVFAAPVLLALAWAVEGSDALLAGARQAGWGGWTAVVWQAVGNTLFGYGVWGWLLTRHAAGNVVPMALLVPLVGFSCSAWYFNEPLPAWKLQGAALVMAGLVLNVWAQRRN